MTAVRTPYGSSSAVEIMPPPRAANKIKNIDRPSFELQ
jgi:hypothetical protein